jgi:hypothetical protein
MCSGMRGASTIDWLTQLPAWEASAALALNTLFSEVVVCLLLIGVARTRLLWQSIGLDLQLVEVKT